MLGQALVWLVLLQRAQKRFHQSLERKSCGHLSSSSPSHFFFWIPSASCCTIQISFSRKAKSISTLKASMLKAMVLPAMSWQVRLGEDVDTRPAICFTESHTSYTHQARHADARFSDLDASKTPTRTDSCSCSKPEMKGAATMS